MQSQVATRFRIWATQRLHEYMQKGLTMDDERLKQAGNILLPTEKSSKISRSDLKI